MGDRSPCVGTRRDLSGKPSQEDLPPWEPARSTAGQGTPFCQKL
jgi:hypothetical protein